MRVQTISAVYLVLRRKGADGLKQVLMAQRSNTGYRDGMWSLPAGHLEANEPPSVGMAREAEEEINFSVRPEALKVLHTMWRSAPDAEGGRIDFYLCPTDSEANLDYSQIKNLEPQKCSALQWWPITALPENTIEEVRLSLEAINQGITYTELFKQVFVDNH